MRSRPTVSPTRAWPYACGLAFALAVLLALAGVSSGATSGTVVSATVPTSTSLDISGCSTPSALAFGSLATTTTTTTASPCHIQFGANAPARLTMYQRDRDGAAMTQVQPTLATRSGVPLYRAVDAVDANDIWVGGNRVNASDPTPLRHTVDGGTTWTDVTACASMSGAINHVAVWSATELLTINGTKVCRSTDTGASWTTITTPQSIGGRISTPAGTDVVWATTASAGRLLRSTDRGATWTSVLVPGAPVGFTNVVGWGTTNAVAVLTTTAADQLSKTATAYTTTDGGATWTSSVIATIPVTTIPAATGNMSLLDRSASGRIVAMGSWALGYQFRDYDSDDSGATWTALAVHTFTDTMRAIGGSTWVGGNSLSTATF
ncbi:MAG: Photosynthesis system assembly factor, partial [Thermoleophilia bacterium]|nr:Photosynthesis system assembly factor [Thermoleophilia bacterium]